MKKRTGKMFIAFMLIAIVAISCVAFVGCKNSETLYVATNAEFPPFEFKDGKKNVGFDMELITAMATEMGYKKVKIKDMDFGGIVESVRKGSYDCGIAGMTINAERLEKVDFTDTYFAATQVMLYKGDLKNFASQDDAYNFLKGKNVATIAAYTGDNLMIDAVAKDGKLFETKTTITPYPNGALAVAALVNSAVDVVVIDKAPAAALAATAADKGVKVDSTPLGDEEEYAMCVQKGNKVLLDKMNAALKTVKENGIFATLYAKYFQN